MNPNKPHKAVINISLEVHSLLDTGECSGHVVSDKGLAHHDIKSHFIITVDGYTLDDCLQKLKQKLEVFQNA